MADQPTPPPQPPQPTPQAQQPEGAAAMQAAGLDFGQIAAILTAFREHGPALLDLFRRINDAVRPR